MTHRRPFHWVTTVFALALTALVGPLTTPTADAQAETVRWLAMGDSYSSGEGIPGASVGNAELQGKNDCQRANGDNTNAKAFAVIAVERLRTSDPGRSWENPYFVACTGAITDDAETQINEMKAQVPQDLQRFDVLSFSFGGNNIKFADILKACLDLNSVWGVFDLTPGCDISEERMRERIDMLVGTRAIGTEDYSGNVTLPEIYDRAAEQVAEGGDVFVVGYPQIVEEVERWNGWQRRLGHCEGLWSYDVGMIRSATGYLNEQIGQAVLSADARWRDRGVRFHFVDIAQNVYETSAAPIDRHGLCSGAQWLNGQTVGITSGDLQHERSFHPTQNGHSATGDYLADLVLDAIDSDISETQPTPGQGTEEPNPSEPVSAAACPTDDETWDALAAYEGAQMFYSTVACVDGLVEAGIVQFPDGFATAEVLVPDVAGWRSVPQGELGPTECAALFAADPLDVGCDNPSTDPASLVIMSNPTCTDAELTQLFENAPPTLQYDVDDSTIVMDTLLLACSNEFAFVRYLSPDIGDAQRGFIYVIETGDALIALDPPYLVKPGAIACYEPFIEQAALDFDTAACTDTAQADSDMYINLRGPALNRLQFGQ